MTPDGHNRLAARFIIGFVIIMIAMMAISELRSPHVLP